MLKMSPAYYSVTKSYYNWPWR